MKSYFKSVYGKWLCYRDKHLWGPKSRRSMYSYIERCKRLGCKASLIDSCIITFEE